MLSVSQECEDFTQACARIEEKLDWVDTKAMPTIFTILGRRHIEIHDKVVATRTRKVLMAKQQSYDQLNKNMKQMEAMLP